MILVCKLGKLSYEPVLAMICHQNYVSTRFVSHTRRDSLSNCVHRDTESAMYSILFWLCLKHQIGTPLENMEVDSLSYGKQMQALKREQAAGVTKSLRQVYLNLMGRNNADNPTNLFGDSLSEDELDRCRDQPAIIHSAKSFHSILYTYFGEHVKSADLVIALGHDHLQKACVGAPFNMWDTLCRGVSCFAAARETGKRKYARMGQVFRSKVKKWLNQGNPNVKHYESLLDAEYMTLKGKNFAAIQAYQASIVAAARGGFQQDAALATERLGEFYWTVMGDPEAAVYQLGQSMKYWGEWGAVAKVRHLEEKYGELFLATKTRSKLVQDVDN
jgi:hypothetical protein